MAQKKDTIMVSFLENCGPVTYLLQFLVVVRLRAVSLPHSVLVVRLVEPQAFVLQLLSLLAIFPPPISKINYTMDLCFNVY